MPYRIPTLPLKNFSETTKILKKAISANKTIAELKGLAHTIPNQGIIINTLALQESKDSSEIENIVTTHDELFKFTKKDDTFSPATKEVYKYNEALFWGFKEVQTKPITTNLLIRLSQIITGRKSKIRNIPGTALKNSSGQIIYTPPQDKAEITKQMKNLEQFMNDNALSDLDPLVKMAIIHHQFESIHPFFDGNGRTGRILNILYLMKEEVLDIPILYLSRYITEHKAEYYQLLQKVREEESWEEWVLYILTALESTATQTIGTIEGIKILMNSYKKILRQKAPKLYSHELMNTIFSHPYTKIEFLVDALHITRITASKYLKMLCELGLLEMKKHKNTNYYINTKLANLFREL